MIVATAAYDLSQVAGPFVSQVQNALYTVGLPVGGAILALNVGWDVLKRLITVDEEGEEQLELFDGDEYDEEGAEFHREAAWIMDDPEQRSFDWTEDL